VATEVDFNSTYVGGTKECVNGILAAGGIEALSVDPIHGVTLMSDRINAVRDEE
jgi:hypothetical protein